MKSTMCIENFRTEQLSGMNSAGVAMYILVGGASAVDVKRLTSDETRGV